MAALCRWAIVVAALALLGAALGGCEFALAGTAPRPAPTHTVPSELTQTMSPTAAALPTPYLPDMSSTEASAMTLAVVFDNYAFDPRLQTGWGFAAWVDYGGKIVLFDTGADGRVLLGNMAALGLRPQAIEVVVLSHIHGDHTGGLAAVLAANPQITIYLPQTFPTHFKEQARAAGATVIEVSGPLEILPGLWSTGQMGTGIVEQGLAAKTAQGLVVITGCAHPGVDRMVTRAKEVGADKVHLVLGGFHLGAASKARVEEIIAEFRRMGVQKVAPCHCTGDRARALFHGAFGQDFLAIGAGWQWQSEAMGWEPSSQDVPAQGGVQGVAITPSDPHRCEPSEQEQTLQRE